MPAISYIAKPILKVNGQAVEATVLEDILQISVEESLHLPGMFTLVLRNDYRPGTDTDAVWKHRDLFAIGKPLELGFVSSTTEDAEFDDAEEDLLLKGEITAIETQFTRDAQAPIIVRGYDASHRLHRGRQSRSFQNKTDTDIVRQIAGEVGLSTGTVEATGGPYGYGDIGGSNGYIFQENQTNMEFLRSRAARHGFELFVQDGKLNFRKPKQDGSLSLEWLKELHSFRVRVSSAEMVDSVEVRGWDYSQKRAIVGTSTRDRSTVITSTDQGTGSNTTKFQGKPSSPKLVVVDQVMSQAEEATTLAGAIYSEVGGEFVQADARSEGNPQIRPGKVVQLTNMDKYSGDYYVTETRHLFYERIYTTEFSVRGLRGGDLLHLLTPPRQLQPGQTCLIGIVADNKDPNNWGRVRVKFPALTEEHMSNWARVVSVGAGAGRGLDCLPEINDEVLVAFEHGDIHRPYILGGLWNGKDAPPETAENDVANGKVRLRTFKTREGHTLQFVDEDKGSSKQGTYLETVAAHKFHLNDTDKFIELKTTDQHNVRLDDQNKKIEVKSTGGHILRLDDGGTKVELTSTGDMALKSGTSGTSRAIDLKGGKITLTATQEITLKVGSNSIKLSPSGIEISGVQVTVKATGPAKVQGAIVDIQGSGITKIQGGVVKIN